MKLQAPPACPHIDTQASVRTPTLGHSRLQPGVPDCRPVAAVHPRARGSRSLAVPTMTEGAESRGVFLCPVLSWIDERANQPEPFAYPRLSRNNALEPALLHQVLVTPVPPAQRRRGNGGTTACTCIWGGLRRECAPCATRTVMDCIEIQPQPIAAAHIDPLGQLVGIRRGCGQHSRHPAMAATGRVCGSRNACMRRAYVRASERACVQACVRE